MAYNKIILHGRITRDVEVKQTQGGTAYCKLTVAVDRQYRKEGEDKITDYIECVAWSKTAEFIGKYFGKGSGIVLDGQLQNNNYEDSNGVKHYGYLVRVDRADFAERKSDSVDEARDDVAPNFTEVPEDGDLPF